MPSDPQPQPRHLVLVLGDQLDRRSAAFDGFDPDRDAIWLAENVTEATHVWCHQRRLALFFSAMRHFRDACEEAGHTVHYHALTPDPAADRGRDFGEILRQDVEALRPERLIVLEPGDWRVWRMLDDTAEKLGVPLDVRLDRHFYVSREAFDHYAQGRKSLVFEFFYRHMRKTEHVLLDEAGEPVGGQWNFDHDNRETFGKKGPGQVKPPRRFMPDDVTQQVLTLVGKRFGDHPGSLDNFDLPVTRQQAKAALRDFIKHRLPNFGTYEDAMWTDAPVLYHSRLSAMLNLHLLDPRECVDAAVKAYKNGDAPLNSVEGFVRQVLGWREFIRGVYWRHMPKYQTMNALRCEDRDVPGFYWHGETDMRCVGESMRYVIEGAYAHHIHRLMVLGLFAQLLGVHPKRFHDWHMAMYLDAVDWVSLPNALGMSQYGDGGIVGTKPYCATGKYIQRMSNYCDHCAYDPAKAVGDDACPFTTLYWDFLARHEKQFTGNQRLTFQMKNLKRKPDKTLDDIRKQARALKARITRGERV